jgi:putative endonuclease
MFSWLRQLAQKVFLKSLAKRDTGRAGEQVAELYLVQQGHKILARNLRLEAGEIDILCEKPGKPQLIVVEVKASAKKVSTRFRPERRVGGHKKKKLKELAAQLRAKKPELKDRPMRFDILGVELDPKGGMPGIRHHQGAF